MKRRIIGIGLVLFALWPLAQWTLVATYDVNPWKLAGWAMYARPSLPPSINLFELRDRGVRPLPPETWTASENERLRDYLARRHVIGRLADVDELARDLLAGHRELSGLVILLTTRSLDEDAMLRAISERYGYSRTVSGEVRRIPVQSP